MFVFVFCDFMILYLPPPRRLCIRRILFLCVHVCMQNIDLKSYERMSMKFCGEVERGPGRNRLDFAGDPDSFVDPGSFFRILYHY